MHLRLTWGTTEIGAPIYWKPKGVTPEEWQYLQVIEPEASVRWEDQGDGTYELIFLVSGSLFPCLSYQTSEPEL